MSHTHVHKDDGGIQPVWQIGWFLKSKLNHLCNTEKITNAKEIGWCQNMQSVCVNFGKKCFWILLSSLPQRSRRDLCGRLRWHRWRRRRRRRRRRQRHSHRVAERGRNFKKFVSRFLHPSSNFLQKYRRRQCDQIHFWHHIIRRFFTKFSPFSWT